MENKFIAILLVLIIFIYIFVNPNQKLEPFVNIDTQDINKSLEHIIEDSETLNLLNKNNKVQLINYKNDSKKFLKDLKKKYEKYNELKSDTNFNNYGQMCQEWRFYDQYKHIEGNDCKKINGNNYQCIVGNGKLTSCDNTKLHDKNIKNNINRNKEIKKSETIYVSSFIDIDKSLEHYSNLLNKQIKKYKANQDIIINQEYFLDQQKNYNKLQKEKLNQTKDNYDEKNNSYNLNFNKSQDEKFKTKKEQEKLSSLKFYNKILLAILALIIFIKMLFIKI